MSALSAVAAVFLGAGLGGVVRYGLGLMLNPLLPLLPLGTLAANLIGGFLVGFFLGWFSVQPQLAPEVKLLLITGFCGGLTTFSTFSAEMFHLWTEGRLGLFIVGVLLHLSGSLLATAWGMALARSWLSD